MIRGNGLSGLGLTDGGVAVQGLTVRDGTITNFFDGIRLLDSTDVVVERMRVIDNILFGINIGNGGKITDSIATGNGGTGITAGSYSIVTGNIASFNDNDGLFAGSGSLIADNIARENDDDGIVSAVGSTVTGNTASINGGDGIHSLGTGNTLTGNTARSNTGDGIEVTCPSNVIGNTLIFNPLNLDTTIGPCNDINNII